MGNRPTGAPPGRLTWNRLLFAVLRISPIVLTSTIVGICNGTKEGAYEVALAAIGLPIFVIIIALADKESRNWSMHLSTAIILMFAASLLLWLNLRIRSGWPVTARITSHYWTPDGSEHFDPVIGFFHVLADAFIAYFLLGIIYRICESRIRRKQESAAANRNTVQVKNITPPIDRTV